MRKFGCEDGIGDPQKIILPHAAKGGTMAQCARVWPAQHPSVFPPDTRMPTRQ